MHKVFLLSLIAFSCHVSWADLQISMPTSVGLKASSTVSWKRASGDPTHFFLQSILFATALQPPGLASTEVIVLDSQLEGTATLVSSFAGPHIVVALDPSSSPFPLLGTSNAFQVGDGGTTTAPLSVLTVTQTAGPSPTNASVSSKSETSTILASVLGTLGGCVLLACIGLFVYRRRSRVVERVAPELEEPTSTSLQSAPTSPGSRWRQNTNGTQNMQIEPFVRHSSIPMTDAPHNHTSLSSPYSESSRSMMERLNALERAVLPSDEKRRPVQYNRGWSSSEEPIRPPSYVTEHS